MALNKTVRNSIGDGEIKSSNIEDGSITSGKISDATTISISKTPLGALPPTISSLDTDQIDPDSGATVTITGTRFVSIPSVFFMNTSTGVRVTASTVGFTSSTTLTAAFPTGQTVGIYKVIVENPDGKGVISSATITYSIAPAWNTAAGSLGSVEEGESVNFSLLAYDDDSTAVSSYSLQSGSLPSGVTLSGDSSVGAITGTAPAVDADTQYNFTIRATDNESQTSDRSFSMTVSNWLVANSLRFDDGSSDDLTLTGQTPTNNKKFTFSGWIKRSALGSKAIMSWEKSSDSSYNFRIAFRSDDVLQILDYAGSAVMDYRTTQVFRDTSAWYHIVVTVDTTDATANDRTKLWVNGERVTSFGTQTTYSLNDSTQAQQSGYFCAIGSINSGTYWDGYQAQTSFIDGTALTPTSFGETDTDSGIWIPKQITGLTFGTNGFYLPFKTSGSLGADSSGNSNDFTVNNLTSIDQTTDTPQNNYCTGNPLAIFNGNNLPTRIPDYSEGNTVATASNGTTRYLLGTFATSMPYYFEVKVLSTSSTDSSQRIGIVDEDAISTSTTYIAEYQADGVITATGETNNTGNQSITTNDIIGVAVDLATNNNIKFYHNGTLQATMSVGASYQNLSTTPYARLVDATQSFSFNFGNPSFTISSGNSDANGYGNFEYAVPSGYYALNTKNLAQYG